MEHAITLPLWAFTKDSDTTTGPPSKPMRAPVFIHDAVIPWRDETLLLKLSRDQAADQDE